MYGMGLCMAAGERETFSYARLYAHALLLHARLHVRCCALTLVLVLPCVAVSTFY